MIKKHWVRKIVLLVIAVSVVTGIALSIKIEPADYRDALTGEISAAEGLLKDARPGNEAGRYAPQIIKMFQAAVERAKSAAEDEALEYDDLKRSCQELQDKEEWFRKAVNTEALPAEEVQELKENGGVFEKEVPSDEGKSVTWRLSGESVQTPGAVSLKTGASSAFEAEIQELLEDGKGIDQGDITLFTIFHDGSLPGSCNLSVEYQSELDNVQIYLYNPDSGELGPLIRGEIKDGTLSFPAREGGTYLIYAQSPSGALLEELLKEKQEPDPQSPVDEPNTSSPGENSSANGNSTEAPSEPSQAPSEPSPTPSEPSQPSTQPSRPPSQSDGQGSSQPQTPSVSDDKKYCTIEIRCDTLSSDLSKLTDPALKPYIPADGVIIARQKIEIYEGETVFDILKRATRNRKVQLEFRNDGGYTGGVYVEGINHLYEFHGGDLSGWMYSVNGWFPNYGCAAYQVKEGDEILWCYTCNLGKDVGGYFG